MLGGFGDFFLLVGVTLGSILLNLFFLILSPVIVLYVKYGGVGNRLKRQMPLPRVPRCVFITGASSGVGEALAYEYCKRARKQQVQDLVLYLTGRNATRLDQVCERCRELGASKVHALVVDVADEAAMREAITKADQERPLDLVIANAGVSVTNTGLMEESKSGATGYERSKKLLDVNIYGALYTIWPALDCMIARQRGGQIAINASIASYIAGPLNMSYSASKAAVRFYGESLRTAMAPLGIRVNTILLGFVESRMTEPLKNRHGRLPFAKSAEEAATSLANQIERDVGVIEYPAWPFGVLGEWLNAAPPLVREWIWSMVMGRMVTRAERKLRKRQAADVNIADSGTSTKYAILTRLVEKLI
ncbi:similar to 11-beta-hydroxysteroid dehydrogenase [Cyanidioschyzon merolae strain 10D]|jgi:NAD(P)-dependent dehydrogenase (short-subunit alcohol dehydrogenase family)|uniref:Similar to 11-beta-hydroxysteroid dehydrogenase n=1 Tax=Cyanidioschyzon merolae (strain NIES-3377 / 10D) TaxID=280699 RepID=M1USD6_CYAM1|nr:similar to 11-beta-hydroxysteroid dehydrogenase [Cyanidioschyzon merolae strain 10D]BAM80596.1 similar to 11-beta-hydroxysteroid dehydrogenase [Cyanidioschyzon merolae strain 10D]|eukprot:XP_005536632.1 similar to 11-beta-hydroxysteroid dehydrogenase [Cyanidioschyzon merolae strain 10D]